MTIYKIFAISIFLYTPFIYAIDILSGTRIIHDPQVGSTTVYLKNRTDTKVDISGWVSEPYTDEVVASFKIEPKHSVIDQEKAEIQVKSNLTQLDHESFYWLNIYETSEVENFVNTLTRVKIFVRPRKLGIPNYDHLELQSSQISGMSRIKNNSPFYVTINDIMYGQKSVVNKSTMIGPYSEVPIGEYPKPGSPVTLKLINDSGWIEEIHF